MAPSTAAAPIAAADNGGADVGAKPKKKGIFAVLAAIGVAASKMKSLLVLLKFSKILTTSATMLLSMAVYAAAFGWRFSVGFVLLIFVHEMGHVIALRAKGIPASAPVFIPFVGALVAMRAHPQDALSEAQIGIAGPVLGSVGALACLGIYHATGNGLYLALAAAGFFINLFNLVPLTPLDGGRVVAAISPKLWGVGLVAMVAAFLMWHNAIILLVLVASLGRLKTAWHNEDDEYFEVSAGNRIAMTIAYIGLAVLLAVLMHATHGHLPTTDAAGNAQVGLAANPTGVS